MLNGKSTLTGHEHSSTATCSMHQIRASVQLNMHDTAMPTQSSTLSLAIQHHSHTHAHTHGYNGHFPGEPGLAGCPIDYKGWWSEFLLQAECRKN